MIAVVCVDERNGMLFNGRRVSRDRLVCEDILHSCSGYLWMEPYSASLFAQMPQEQLRVETQFLEKAEDGAWCFVEREPLSPYLQKLEQIVIYHWNRHYPADTYLDISLKDWTLVSTEEFAGYSHPKITKEIYRR